MALELLGREPFKRPASWRTAEEVRLLFNERRLQRSPVLRQMEEVRDWYQGDVVVPLPEMSRDERSSIPNLVYSGIEQTSMRIASTMPMITVPPRNPSVKREVRDAETRRRAMYGWWQHSELTLVQRQRARWFTAYACAPVLITPNEQAGVPKWEPKNPLTAYPSDTDGPHDLTPRDCVFAASQTYGWLRRRYPEQFEQLRRHSTARLDDRVTVLSYYDDEQVMVLAVADRSVDPVVVAGARGRESVRPGAVGSVGWTAGIIGSQMAVVLANRPNRAGVCPVVVPGRITLDRILGQFDQMLGMAQMSARLMALELIAIEKGVFPDMVVIGRDGRTPKLLNSGGWKDGRTGEINMLVDGDMQEVRSTPGSMTDQAIARLERGQRLTGGIPAEFGGESPSNIRTGKRGDAVLSAAVDFPIQEAQEVFARALQQENKIGVAVAKGYFGRRKTTFHVEWKGAKGHLEYVPNEVFTTDENIVRFPMAGTDVNGFTILLGQYLGMDAISVETVMENIPFVEDVRVEKDRIVAGKLERAIIASIEQKLANGEMAPADGAWLYKAILADRVDPADALLKLEERVRERQASSGEVGAPDGPVLPGSPEAMAGLAAGTAAEAQAMAPTIPEPSESQGNLTSILGQLRLGQRMSSAERGVA